MNLFIIWFDDNSYDIKYGKRTEEALPRPGKKYIKFGRNNAKYLKEQGKMKNILKVVNNLFADYQDHRKLKQVFPGTTNFFQC